MGETEKCLAAGEQGVRLQPDLSMAHYFYAGCLVVTVEAGLGNYQKGMDGLTQALILEPQIGVQWMVAGFGALLTGQYAAAQWLFEGAAHIEKTPNPRYRFVGASSMLGFVQTRQLSWDAARRCHQESIAAMRSTAHVYRDAFTALSACGLGEIELRNEQPQLALTHFRHAWRILQEQPRMLGNVRLGIRSQAGMAAAYAALEENEKAERHLSEATSRMGALNVGSWIWDTLLCQLHYSVASAQLRLGFTSDAVNSLCRAIDTGLADASWLALDPEWRPLRERSDFRQLVERVRLIPPVVIDLSRIPSLESATSNPEIVQPL
jgi:tetratricopeptide (TPR) repeat protein